jgi:hypothetical protein
MINLEVSLAGNDENGYEYFFLFITSRFLWIYLLHLGILLSLCLEKRLILDSKYLHEFIL